MRTFLYLAGLGAVGCGGADNTIIGDSGSDGTASDGAGSDSTVNDSGSGGDSANDSGNGNDSGMNKDSGWSQLFSCGGMMTCDASYQYCHLQDVGPQPVDGGFSGSASCLPYPSACGSSPSCGCVPTPVMCMCTSSGPDITVRCGGV